MKKLIIVIIVLCSFSHNLLAQQLKLASATEQEWDYTPGCSHPSRPYPKGIKYRFNFNCSDYKSIVFDSIFLGSEKSLLFYGNSSDIVDTLHHFYTLLYKGNLYMNTRCVDNPIVILYEYKGVKYSLLVKDITSLPTWGEYKMGIR